MKYRKDKGRKREHSKIQKSTSTLRGGYTVDLMVGYSEKKIRQRIPELCFLPEMFVPKLRTTFGMRNWTYLFLESFG